MPQTFYVTQDEEILSIVGRLRSSELLENVFVIPKRALVLQSIVNLRMLSREAEKSGKQVIIVTQDENGRRLAEKAGLGTRAYSEEALREAEPVIRELPPEESDRIYHPGIFSDSIGSAGFFATEEESSSAERSAPRRVATSPAPSDHTTADGMRLRIRNASPGSRTSLNSLRLDDPSADAIPPVVPTLSRPMTRVQASPTPAYHPVPTRLTQSGNPGRLSQVFTGSHPTDGKTDGSERESRHRPKRPAVSQAPSVHVDGKGKFLFGFFVTITIIFLLGTGAFIFLPKAVISVTPQSVSQDLSMEFEGRTDASATGDTVVPVRLVEKDEEITVTGTTSGSSAGNGSKATGKVIIYNEYGPDAQQLVATTRFQSDDGKVFRLSKGVTVPGITKQNGQNVPGVVEADIVADVAGSAYDIGPTNFSIPGFSGGPKAGKIYAKSKSAMTGGSSSGSSGAVAVSASDIDQAKKDAVEKFRESFATSLGSEVASDERFIKETFDIAVTGNPTVPRAGTVSSSFEYRATFHGKAFVFSEDKLHDVAVAILRKQATIGDGYAAQGITFRYDGGTADYPSGALHFKVGVNAIFVAGIDTATLRADFLGKNQDEIKQALENHPEVKNIEIDLTPKGLSLAVPKDPNRVTVTVVAP
ncbi:MAG: hypothetical protein WCJ25_02380 [Candidatus Moraniibacteriota bacterium]